MKAVVITSERLVQVAEQLEAALVAEFDVTFVVKDTAPVHLAIAEAFDAGHLAADKVATLASFLSLDPPELNLPSGAEYLTDFATTLGDVVGMPRRWRTDPTRVVTRLLVGPHEVVHGDQHHRGVDAGLWPKVTSHSVLYASSIASDQGAEYVGHVEGDGYGTTEALRAWLNGGTRRPIESVVDSLRRHYALRPAGADVAEATLRSHYATMDDGGIPNVRVCRFTLAWLEANAADLKGQVPA